ncbi:MAG: EVE domain-containing protein [Gemmatimonadaceae bacterium]
MRKPATKKKPATTKKAASKKKAAPKTTVARKPAAKKPAVKKAAVKKAAVKRAAVKKAAVKKAAVKRTAVRAREAVPPSQFATPEGGPWGKCFLPRTNGEKRFWLVKSEPETFGWSDLLRAPNQTTHWDGVRNHAARNFLRDGMRHGDLVFFYHSSTDPSAIVGICEVQREAYPDPTALDPAHPGYDPESSPAKPTWFMVDLRAVEPLPTPVTLAMIKKDRALAQMALLRIGRLSVTPVTPAEWSAVIALSRA